MSNTTNVGNFSVNSFTSPSPVTEGELINDYLVNHLTLIPNEGFAIKASDFSATAPLPDYVQSVVFFQSTQDSRNVTCQVSLIPGSVMPPGGIDIGLCISGFSNTASYCIGGSVSYGVVSNVVPATLNTTYDLCASYGATENVFTQAVSAATGYYFPTQPTISLITGDINSYSVNTSNVLDISGNIINTVFTVDYTFPNINITGDAWGIEAVADIIYIPVVEITNYNVSTSAFSEQGGFRYYTIYGSEGANWTLTAVGTNNINDILSLSSDPFTNVLTGTIDSSGMQEIAVNIPASTTGPQSFDLTISGDLRSPFAQNTTVTLNQLSDVTITYSAVTSLGYLITPGNYAETGFSYASYSADNRPVSSINWTIDPIDPANTLVPISQDVIVEGQEFANITFLNSSTGFTHLIAQTSTDPNAPNPTGWNFINNTSYGNYIEVQSIDWVAGEITFNTSISVLANQKETISENKGNNVDLILSLYSNSGSAFIVGDAYVDNFGFADKTFTFLVDEMFKEVSLPTVITTAISNQTGTDANSGGETITDGNGNISGKGIQWSSLADFSVIDGETEDGTGTVDYVSNITGLTSGNTYYVRAYVVNEAGVGYGQVIQFVATAAGVPCGQSTSGSYSPGGSATFVDNTIGLSGPGGLIALLFNAAGAPDKLEIIHGDASGIKVATSNMNANMPSPVVFDNVYGTEAANTIPTETQVSSIDQFIGTNKGSIPTRQAEFTAATGYSVPTLPNDPNGQPYQQIVWWEYTAADYAANPIITVRVTEANPSLGGTGWAFLRMCCPDGNCTV